MKALKENETAGRRHAALAGRTREHLVTEENLHKGNHRSSASAVALSAIVRRRLRRRVGEGEEAPEVPKNAGGRNAKTFAMMRGACRPTLSKWQLRKAEKTSSMASMLMS